MTFLPTSPASGAFDSVTVETATGAYGKLPFHGDFVTRDLPPDFIRQWDEWLQRALQASKDAMQTQWHDTFLTSPIWRFVIAPGIVGDSCWMGCMSPSSDSVGRIFPVTFAREYPQETNPFLLAMLSEAWMQGVEKEILAIFDAEEGSVDTILDRVNALEPPDIGGTIPRSSELGFGESWCYKGFGGPGGYFTAHLSDQMLSHQLGTYAMWWGLGSQALEPSVLLTRQLPDAHQFIAMITGAWTEQGWYTIDRTDAF